VSALIDRARAALVAGESARAKTWALDLLKADAASPENEEHGNAVYYGHLILGEVAFQDGQIAEAKRELLLAGGTPGSEALDQFGPDMALAKRLLQKGERAVVLEYLKICERFAPKDMLKLWQTQIEQGKMPDFTGHLDY
jgi:hypothetical protein